MLAIVIGDVEAASVLWSGTVRCYWVQSRWMCQFAAFSIPLITRLGHSRSQNFVCSIEKYMKELAIPIPPWLSLQAFVSHGNPDQ
jgi:hypothetical protein